MIAIFLPLLLAADPAESFDRDVKPIVAKNCFKCHDGEKPKAGLKLSASDKVLVGLRSGPVVIAGNPAGSLLYQVLAADYDPHMPPEGQLSASEIATIENWIKSLPVAVVKPRKEMQVTDRDRQHWAFQPIRKVDPPRNGMANPVDAFVFETLKANKLDFASSADPRVLVRRLSFSLTGLPPTPGDADAFAANPSPDAYAKLIDKYLDSPHYGECWARHWLDVARYSDIDADQRGERPDPNASGAGSYHYRDYVIRSFNANKPFDRFVSEQVAGDLLYSRDREAVIATAFLKLSPPSGAQGERARFDDLDDTLGTTSAAFLGLTVGCARCHDHKTDPIPQRDYYRFMAVFAGTERTTVPIAANPEKAAVTASDKSRTDETANLRARLEELEKPERDRIEEDESQPEDFVGPPPMSRWWRQRIREREKIQAQLQSMGTDTPRGPTALAVAESASPPKSFLLLRGDPKSPSDEVAPGVPVVLSKTLSDGPPREALAKWLTDPGNPLTARVFVNRVWHYHFGRGLVATPSNFGTTSGPPTHPELLEWLAAEFIRSGWDVKHLHRLVLTSRTFQQTAKVSADAKRLDPDNKLWSRFERRRLEAESIRDAVLFCSGRLNPVPYGPGARARAGDVNLAPEAARSPLAVREGPQQWRRSIYLGVSRSNPSVMLESFDQPPPACPCDSRPATVVPPQALLMLNAPFVIEQADFLARRAKREAGTDPAAQVDRLYRLALGRPPHDAEKEKALKFLADPVLRSRTNRRGDDPGALADLAHVIYNLNEFMTLD